MRNQPVQNPNVKLTPFSRNPTMAPNSHLILLTIFLLTLTAVQSTSSSRTAPSPKTFYEVLESNDLPIGLFPKGISDFSIDEATGRFEIHLLTPSPCDAKFETRVRYEWNITGSLGMGKIADLSGVAAQELFLWLPVKGIRVDMPSTGLICFDVGVVFKQFSLSFFETPQDCNALGEEDGERGMLFFDGFERIAENQARKIVRDHVMDEEQRAVS